MKKKLKFKSSIFFILASFAVLILLMFISYFMIFHNQIEKFVSPPFDIEQKTDNEIFSEDMWRKNLEPFLAFKEEKEKKEKPPLKESEIVTPQDPDKPSQPDPIPDDPIDPIEPEIQKEAYFASSLTNSSGAVFVSGKSLGYSVEINGNPIETSAGKFQQGASSNFKVRFYNENEEQLVHISSPAYSTNAIIKNLTVGVDPFNQYMTLHGRINLNLPGEMSGDLINVSNGVSNSTVLQNGVFNLSVPLQRGVNQITARGRWLTISLDLPSITIQLK